MKINKIEELYANDKDFLMVFSVNHLDYANQPSWTRKFVDLMKEHSYVDIGAYFKSLTNSELSKFMFDYLRLQSFKENPTNRSLVESDALNTIFHEHLCFVACMSVGEGETYIDKRKIKEYYGNLVLLFQVETLIRNQQIPHSLVNYDKFTILEKRDIKDLIKFEGGLTDAS